MTQTLRMLLMGTAILALAASGVAPEGEVQIYPANAGFEEGGLTCPPRLWTEYNLGGAVGTGCATDEAARTGYRSARITDPGAGVYTGLVSSRVAIHGGLDVAAKVWVKSAGADRPVHLFLYIYDAAGVLLDQSFTEGTAGADWSRVRVEMDTPLNAASADMLIYSCMACGGTFYADDASFGEWVS